MSDLSVNDVVWDASVYPRQKWNTSTIERYAEAMRSGAVFPPITVEEGTNRLLDGKHRLEAYKKAIEQPGMNGEAPAELRVEAVAAPSDIPVKMFAASLSNEHGDRLSLADLRAVVREAYADNPGLRQEDVARRFRIRRQAVSEMVSDILAREREERAGKALRLSMLGHTQRAIAAALGVSADTANKDLSDFADSGIFGQGHAPEEIARRYGLPLAVVHAKLLEGKNDQERLKHLGIKVQPYDVWHFTSCHDLMGDKHPGRIPGELVCHTLYFYTQPGDLVIDPMAGSGTTLDAALLMGRKARGYDIDHRHDRIDIERRNLDDGWPEATKSAALVFWDPPYFDKMDQGTIGSDGYIKGSVSGRTPDEYLAWFGARFTELRGVVNPGTRLAFLMSDWDPENAKRHKDSAGIFVWDYADVLREAGWKIERQIQTPLSTQQVHPDIVNKFRESRRLARLGRYLLIARPA